MTTTQEGISEAELNQWEQEIAQPETWGGYNPVVSRLIDEVRRLQAQIERMEQDNRHTL